MKSMPSPTAIPTKASRQLPQLLATVLEAKMSKLKQEMQFYEQVLRWLFYNSRQEEHREIQILQEELKILCDVKWRSCVASVGNLQEEARDVNLYANQSQQCFNELSVEFQLFKVKLQSRFNDLVHIRLW